jgi:hypothetical protein
MNRKTILSLVLASAVAAGAFAAAKSYQVTGNVVEVKADAIVVEAVAGKNKGEKFEIARDASTKLSGEPKAGDKVTVEYRMTATSIEVKSAEAKPKAKKK